MTRIDFDWNEHPGPREVVGELRRAGHEAWLAGGCVRDLLLGRVPKDFDVATSASPDQVRAAFRRTVPVKPELGVTLVLWEDERIETTTFRTEGAYLDGRRPSSVGPATAEQDVQRRDFTINGLLLDPLSGEIADHVGGLADLRDGILRCIRDPGERFEEDHLRILRAVRFSVRFGFGIEAGTWEAMRALSGKVARLSGERIHEELSRMFESPFAPCLPLLRESGVLEAVSPALSEALGSAGVEERLAALCAERLPSVDGLWPTVLLLPLCGWFLPESVDRPAERAGFLEKLRASRQEIDASRLCWERWPALLPPLSRPSTLAPILRDRNWPVLRALVQVQTDRGWAPIPPISELDGLSASIPAAPPALGVAFQEAGIPRGPRLGDAIREADRRILDEGAIPDATLVREVTEAILGAG
jgi:tRNA nucleotidyltransferase/poly(A) polymerase